MKKSLANAASVEKVLEREIATLVYDSIGQCPADVSCTFIGTSDLAVLIDNVRTPLEEFLCRSCQPDMVRRYRQGMERAMGKRVHQLIERVVARQIDQVSISHKSGAKWMGIFTIL